MRIVSRKEFLNMPDGTVFVKFAKQPKDGKCRHLHTQDSIAIKDGICGNDFIVQDLIPTFIGVDDSLDWSKVMCSMLDGNDSPPVDYYCNYGDGLYDDDELFLVWNRDDLSALIQRLIEARDEGY